MPGNMDQQKNANKKTLLEISNEMKKARLLEKKLKYGFDFSTCQPFDVSGIVAAADQKDFQKTQN